MDLGSETELDYEEELQFNTDENKSLRGTFMGNRKQPNESSSCCDDDQYLQIDYSEEDDNLTCSNIPSGIASTNINLSQTEDNSGVLCEGKKIINRRKKNLMSKYKINRGCYNIPHNLKSKPSSHFCQPFCKKNNAARPFTVDQLSNSTLLNTMPISLITPSSQRPNDQNSFHYLNSTRVQQFQSGALSILSNKFQQFQPFSSPSFDFSQNQQGCARNSKAQFQTSNMVKYSSSRSSRFCPNSTSGNIDYNLSSEVTKSQGDTFRNRLSVDMKKYLIDKSDCSTFQMHKKIDFNNEINCNKGSNFCMDTEKELVRLKRAARLIRFGNENYFQRSKTEDKTCHKNLYFEDKYFRKMEDQKHKRQKIFELKEKQRHICNPEVGDKLMKFNTREDTLLKKINPFYAKSVPHILDNKIKQEKHPIERETKNVDLKEGLHIIKCDFDSNVKFTRTISKTYEEMSLLRCSDKEVTDTEATSISVQAKEESQSRGCIVEVLNLPQVTTSDVLSLCSPVGKPLEVKLNVLKENAVTVKFANPIFAANFYGLYHGVKVKSNFLNVTII